MRRFRILLVEDDGILSELMAELLDVLGHEVCGSAATEADAIDAAALHAPDLMIVDAYLRVGTGVSAMNIISRRTPMPHVFMTGGSRHSIPREAIVLYKPFGTAELTRALESAWSMSSVAAGSAQPRR